jgi:Nickel responsive protein SCO4226-like
MPKYVIERVIPGAGQMSTEDLKAVSLRSCNALSKLGTQIQWIHSYVTDNKVYCVYIAPNEEMIREHARLSGIPATHIADIMTVIDPTTAE